MKGFLGFPKRVYRKKIENGHFSFASNLVYFVTQCVGSIHLAIKQKQYEG